MFKALGDAFSPKFNTTLLWKKAGSGESLKALKEKTVDMIMVHAPAAEKKAVEEGWATRRFLIGSNGFFIVGPADDPAKVSEVKIAADAFARIADNALMFGGLDLWDQAGGAMAMQEHFVTVSKTS